MRTAWAAGLLAVLPGCTTPLDASGQRCGGNTINSPKCPTGYTCVSTIDGGPAAGDVGGVCQKGDPVSNPPTGGGGAATGGVGGGGGGSGAGGSSGADASIDAATDAGTTCCENCGAGMTCAYPIADECTAVGACVKIPAPTPCNAVSLLTGCGCDGRAVMWHGACQPDLPEGYAPMPIVHTGSCP
jgi:hypothetical protein